MGYAVYAVSAHCVDYFSQSIVLFILCQYIVCVNEYIVFFMVFIYYKSIVLFVFYLYNVLLGKKTVLYISY